MLALRGCSEDLKYPHITLAGSEHVGLRSSEKGREMRHSLARYFIGMAFSAEHRMLAISGTVPSRLTPLFRRTTRSKSTQGSKKRRL